jgi:hypothetical protein
MAEFGWALIGVGRELRTNCSRELQFALADIGAVDAG